MFEGFANLWTPVELARRLGRRPRRVEVAGERVVLFRGAGGRVGALLDRCPHRGAALSLGRVVDGCVECPFHGWRFAPDGACVAVPLNDTTVARRAQLGATPLPVREEGGLLWLYTRPGRTAPDAPTVPAALEFIRPNGMRLRLEERGRVRWLHLWCVPVDEARTRVLLATLQSTGRYNPFRPLLNLFNQYVGREDRRVAESLQPPRVPEPHAERHVPTDRPTLLFRRYYFEELAGSSAPPPGPREVERTSSLEGWQPSGAEAPW